MNTYYRLSDAARLDLTAEQFAAMQANGKAAGLRLWVSVAAPVPSASQKAVEVAPTIDVANATQTWQLVAKTQAELDADAQSAELSALKAMVAALTADVQDGITAAPTTAAQAFVAIQDLKRRALRADRAIRWLLKQQA